MQIHGASDLLLSGSALQQGLSFIGEQLIKNGAVPARRPRQADTRDAFLAEQLLTPWLRAAALPGKFALETCGDFSIAYGFLDLEYDTPRLGLRGPAQRWGPAFVAALLPWLHQVAAHLCPLISPFNAGGDLLGMFGDYTRPEERQEIMAHLREFHGLAGSDQDIELSLAREGLPTPRALLLEFEPYLAPPATLADLRELALPLDPAAQALVQAVEDLAEWQADLNWQRGEGVWNHPEFSEEGEEPVGLVLSTVDPRSDDWGWCEHALDRRREASMEVGVRPLWLWHLDQPEQRAELLRFVQRAPQLGAAWQRVTQLLAE